MRRSEVMPVAVACLVAVGVLVALMVLVVLSGCQPRPPVVVQNRPDFVGDAAPPADGPSDDCAASCAAWRALRCPEANPTGTGVSCEVVCRNAEQAGLDSAKDVGCAARATACAQLRACPY